MMKMHQVEKFSKKKLAFSRNSTRETSFVSLRIHPIQIFMIKDSVSLSTVYHYITHITEPRISVEEKCMTITCVSQRFAHKLSSRNRTPDTPQ